ncbi:MAG: hypothetical protein A4E60_01732 [Syntrophorhabdus sp. PtaB.Bin047]|nr:MAG: hypothetical protein A4E60_01732 [Syntrophorhabdus sp. PtaB.Bin047]
MTRDEEIRCGMEAYRDALWFAAGASTREDLAGVEESYWIAFNKLRESPLEEHRLICAECLEAVARILDGEGRRDAGNDLREQAEVFRKPRVETQR